jgi:transcriptional regulator with XRE-family HTH domain
MARTPQEFRREFGRRLRRRRHMLGKTQAAIAAAIDMDRVQYSQMEGGRYQAVQLIDLARLGDALQTSLDYLLLRTSDDPVTIPP